jgi:nucleotide-binding universal stress UspA family protein
MQVYRRILHASDFSRSSKPAFRMALALAKQNHAELRLVHVLPPPTPFLGEVYVAPSVYAQVSAAARTGAERRLAGLVREAEASGIRVRAELLEGSAWEEIVQRAKSARAELVVLGTHGRTGIARVVAGSVASRVVQMSRCPVLTVRGS